MKTELQILAQEALKIKPMSILNLFAEYQSNLDGIFVGGSEPVAEQLEALAEQIIAEWLDGEYDGRWTDTTNELLLDEDLYYVFSEAAVRLDMDAERVLANKVGFALFEVDAKRPRTGGGERIHISWVALAPDFEDWPDGTEFFDALMVDPVAKELGGITITGRYDSYGGTEWNNAKHGHMITRTQVIIE